MKCLLRTGLRFVGVATMGGVIAPIPSSAQETEGRWSSVSVIQMPYTGARNVPELSDNPAYLFENGVSDSIRAMGFSLTPPRTVRLTAEDEEEYGSWHRMGLANGHLAAMVAENWRSGILTVGLLGNCTSVIGVLGSPSRSRLSRNRNGRPG